MVGKGAEVRRRPHSDGITISLDFGWQLLAWFGQHTSFLASRWERKSLKRVEQRPWHKRGRKGRQQLPGWKSYRFPALCVLLPLGDFDVQEIRMATHPLSSPLWGCPCKVLNWEKDTWSQRDGSEMKRKRFKLSVSGMKPWYIQQTIALMIC